MPIDSGFGPFALTRLCYETGGIYFAVHPNRNVNRAVSRRQTSAYSAHLQHFFDAKVMERYRPEYVSSREYMRRVNRSKMRSALVNAAQLSWVSPLADPKTEFVKKDEASWVKELSEAQQGAALLEPKVRQVYEALRVGERDRKTETSIRWQAGFDLAMGRVLAVKVRTESYNAMLAAAKRGLKPRAAKNNTWTLVPANEVTVGSRLANDAKRAREYLQRTIQEHPGTPWAHLAKRELETPVGWKWVDSYTDLAPQRQRNANNNNNPRPPRNDRIQMLKKPPPRRPPPKL